ncbi:MAG: glycoside hydrolase family 9 protein [Lachnospiraceae bacterium]|nr:glycoside hydrolase family 9 protein [Lachnospiraceae bacterium]
MEQSFSAIRMNQTGYAESLPVRVAVLGEGPLTLSDGDGKTVKSVSLQLPEPDEASGDRVQIADLGRLPAGTYQLTLGEETRQIRVERDPWKAVTNALIKGLYFQRCGCDLEEKYAGKFVHPACHTAPAALWENPEMKRTVIGGWHDAGDYGKYVGPGAVTVAHMLYAWLLFESGCEDPLNIPESGNGIPDILNEARYELEWMLQMQREDGAFHHKLTKAWVAPFIMPQDDHEPEYLMPVSHCATAAACACLALAVRVYKAFDPDFADRMLGAALEADKWLEAHPEFVPYTNPEGVHTGMYGDREVKDELFWAACELYAVTGEAAYREKAEALFSEGLNVTAYGWADVSGLGASCCLFVLKEKAGETLYGALKKQFLEACGSIAALTEKSGYGTALSVGGYGWGSILPILGNAMSLILASILTGEASYENAALLQWDYALGLNALDLCFVTGFGERSVQNPHHRPSGADDIPEPVPGLISGGPNKHHTYPMTKEKLGDAPAAKYYLDETFSADTNEIAIYWNSPAIFVGAYFRSRCLAERKN